MGFKHILTFLPLAAAVVQAQNAAPIPAVATTEEGPVATIVGESSGVQTGTGDVAAVTTAADVGAGASAGAGGVEGAGADVSAVTTAANAGAGAGAGAGADVSAVTTAADAGTGAGASAGADAEAVTAVTTAAGAGAGANSGADGDDVTVVTTAAGAGAEADAGIETVTAVGGASITDFNATSLNATTTNSTNLTVTEEIEEIISAPIYTQEECNRWIDGLKESDVDSSNGLSETEYHDFLTSIEGPPYISAYFQKYDSFDRLPWMFRVVHKSLACHCQKLGMGEECCKGDDAEVLLLGLTVPGLGMNGSAGARVSPQEEYKDLFCQQISYVLTKSVPSPAPTGFPTESPSDSPTVSPSGSPSGSPTTTPTGGPTTAVPTQGPTVPPSYQPTEMPTLSPIDGEPLKILAAPEPEEESGGLGTGGIIGIVIACLLALLAVIALVAYRKKLERDRLRKFAGQQAPEADLEASPPGELYPDPNPQPDHDHGPGGEPEEDDESSAPSVWSEGDSDRGERLVDVNDGDDKVTAGSALAAMGAASTVAANLTRGNHPGSASDTSSQLNSVV